MQLWATPQEALRLLVQAWQEHTRANTRTLSLSLMHTHSGAYALLEDAEDLRLFGYLCWMFLCVCLDLFVLLVTCRRVSEAKAQLITPDLQLQGQHGEQQGGCCVLCKRVCACYSC